MEFGINKKKIQVVWLCHFANQEMKNYFKTPDLNEFAPWINNLIELFQLQSDVELHIVAPNVFTNKDSCFTKGNINYHFYKRIPIPTNNKYIRNLHTLLQIELLTNFYWIKHKINITIKKIKPAIIHLHGAENPYYSAGILQLLNKYPTLTTIQGFRRNLLDINSSFQKKAIKIEETIIKNTKHIGIRTDDMSKIALQINPDATLHFHNYSINKPTIYKDNIGKTEPIDCLFFARVCKEKGIEDLLHAISIVKMEYSEISLSVIGGTSKSYLSDLKKLCIDLNIENNVRFLGFFPTQEAIYKYALQAKICVLPTYHDIIPGTIIESMFLKLPVVAYSVGGIPELNCKEQTVILVEKENIKQLSEKIIQLLKNIDLRIIIAEKANLYAQERFNTNNIAPDIINIYKAILNNENNKIN